MFGLTPEMLSLIGGGLSGFVFRFMSERAKNREAQFKMLIQSRELGIQERDAASQRDGEAGKWVRRVIVLGVFSALVFLPYLLTIYDFPIFVQVVEEKKGFMWGLFGGGIENKFVEINGFPILDTIILSMNAIVGYYLGQASAK